MSLKVPAMAMEVLAILYEERARSIPIAHTVESRAIQRAIQWLQVNKFVAYLDDDLWQITDTGTNFFNAEVERTS